ncbi:hypothetical protein GOBAR_AA16591 [Gossypium barbadense]|uniref:DUF4110 domain-containing protein n=1 Tax=Gossypium barbadense TaxID=3634 RepID=A0A2P5XL74_GOSBA|nr:hypothetical protein GOBAR_AA16591 [Gossypium barbadense]
MAVRLDSITNCSRVIDLELVNACSFGLVAKDADLDWCRHFCMVIFTGGEFTSPNQERFHHYKDFWMLDLKTNQWEQLNLKGCPSPRSGHRMLKISFRENIVLRFSLKLSIQKEEAKKKEVHVDENVPAPSPRSNCSKRWNGSWFQVPTVRLLVVLIRQLLGKILYIFVLYKHKIIVFGGFYDTLREVRYYNDLHIFDLDEFKWQEIKPRLGSMWPSARSGFQFFVYQDQIYLYGGYYKEVSSDKNSSALEKGIVHADMWSLDPKTWEWNKVKKSGMPPSARAGFSMCVHKKRAMLFGGVVDMEMEGDVMMSLFLNELYGFQLDNHRWYPLELRKEKSTKVKSRKDSKQETPGSDYNDKVNIEAKTSGIDDKDQIMEYDEEAGDEESNIDEMSEHIVASMTINDESNCLLLLNMSNLLMHESVINFQVVKPCGRINSCMVVGKDTLYIYGGMMEVKDREITLDDLYSLNLSKLDEWKCIIPGTNDGTKSVQMGDAVALIRGEGKNLRRKEKRVRLEQIRANLGLSDSQRTPTPGESLRDFYRRTNLYWQMAAHEHTQHTGKELRKDGFDLAEARYRELKPLLDELAILEAEQKAEEAEGPETSSRKRGKKRV